MLTDIKSVADEIDSDIRTGARAPHVSNQSPSILKGIGDDIRLVTGLFGKQIGILSGQNNTPECMERAMALKARIRALPYCDFGYFGFLLSRVLDEGSTIHDGLDSLTDVERWVNLIYMPQYPGTEEFDQAMRSRLEQYISSFKSLWRRISEMVDGYVLGGIFVRSPFVNEFWVPHQSVHGDFLDHLQRADTESILRQDSLGRTSLHFLIEYGVDSKVADYLLNHRNLLDVTDAFGRTALHVACSRKRQGGSYSTVRLLLQKKATIGIRDAYGLLAIDYAVIDNREDILRVFQEVRGVDIQGTLVAMKQAEEERKRVAVAVDAACEHLDKEIVKKARNGQDLVMLS
jgi:hypothetical protein